MLTTIILTAFIVLVIIAAIIVTICNAVGTHNLKKLKIQFLEDLYFPKRKR